MGLPLRGDGTEDNSNFMQVLQLRAEDNPLIHEWLKRKNLDTTDAKTIVTALKDVMVALNLDIHRLRGQCYDGASTMSGA